MDDFQAVRASGAVRESPETKDAFRSGFDKKSVLSAGR